MSEADPAPVVEEAAPVANGGAAADATAADKKDKAKKEEAGESKEVAVGNKNFEEQKQGDENGINTAEDKDVKTTEAVDGKAVDGDGTKEAGADDVKMVDTEDAGNKEAEDVKMADTEDVVKKEDEDVKTVDSQDAKMAEAAAEAGNAEVEDEGQKEKEEEKSAEKQKEDKEEKANVEKQDEEKGEETGGEKEEVNEEEKSGTEKKEELKEEQKCGTDKQEEEKVEEKAAEKQEEENEEEKGATGKQEEEKGNKDGAKKQEQDAEATQEQGSEEVNKKVEENKEETPKNKKARSVRERSQGKDKRQAGSKSREAKDLLNTPSPYALDRPVRERKTVERLVEVIEKEPNRNFVVEKGRGTPLKDIPNVAHKLARKKASDLKFLHQILFGRRGKAVDFKIHILQFSGFVWHESDEKQRAKAKEKLDKYVKDALLDLCDLFDIPVSKTNTRKEDLVVKLLDFIAAPHAIADSVLSDEQGSNSRKRKRGGKGSATKNLEGTPKRSRKKFDDEGTPSKKGKKALNLETDEEEDEEDNDEHMKSESEENIDEDADEEADEEEEDDYDSGKEKAAKKKSSEGKGSAGKKKAVTGSSSKMAPLETVAKSPSKTSSSKISKDKETPDEGAKVFSRKRKTITPKRAASSEKETKGKKSSGKKATKGKGKAVEAEKSLPSKDELRKTITEILKQVDFNTATFSDILKKLDEHYKMDMTPRKAAIKMMIQEELTKLTVDAEEDEDEDEEDAEKKKPERQAKVLEA